MTRRTVRFSMPEIEWAYFRRVAELKGLSLSQLAKFALFQYQYRYPAKGIEPLEQYIMGKREGRAADVQPEASGGS